jgi:hypothetical protein
MPSLIGGTLEAPYVTIRIRDVEKPDAETAAAAEPVRGVAEEDAYRAACRRYARLSGRRR